MFENKLFWYFSMICVIVTYVFLLILGRYLWPDDSFKSWFLFIGMFIVHTIEIPAASLKIGKEKGIAVPIVVLKTILFGFTWWLPLKKGVIKK